MGDVQLFLCYIQNKIKKACLLHNGQFQSKKRKLLSSVTQIHTAISQNIIVFKYKK